MFDNFISCDRFFKRISDCKIVDYGIKSDHSAVLIKFRITAIKFINTQKEITVTDWEKIRTNPATRATFNAKLTSRNNTEQSGSDEYTAFNQDILTAAAETATKLK